MPKTDPALFIGIDLGTSGCRAIAINKYGVSKASASFSFPDPQKQSPQQWWSATQNVLQNLFSKIDSQKVKAIAVDGTSSTVLLCDDNGETLTPALMYNDQSARQQALFLQQHAPQDSIVLNATSSLAKVLYLIEKYNISKPFHIVHQADWISGKLCQQFNFSDTNNVLKLGYNALNKTWPIWLLDLFTQLNIDHKSLPKVFSPSESISEIHPAIAKAFSLSEKVKIVAGTTDSTAAFIASGANETGQAVTSLGSSLVLKIINDKPINDPTHGVYSQPYGEHWLVGGASNSGGAVLRHYFSDEKILELTKELQPEINTGLNYYPLLKKGERFPVNDANLSPRLTPKAKTDLLLFQGILEGIADIERTGYQLLKKLGAPYPKEVKTNGGGARNIKWQSIREQTLGTTVTKATHTEAAYGAALLALKRHLT